MGQSYPSEAASRSIFAGLNPQNGQSKDELRQLYSEITHIRRGEKNWLWHLPKGSYEETEALITKWRTEREAKKEEKKVKKPAQGSGPMRFYQ